ncbi:MAG TPA: hypothetical protein VF522_14105 [Ramlibacter sp.]|uniref:hypothetical protein n=1 Tax=Ramlibacter sp. TaxID=1917967 RepID=UPI002ED13A8A
MNRITLAKPLLAGAIGLAALAAVPAAQARSDVQFSIGIGVPYGYVQPAPVYVQPAPVYVQPQPVYVQPEPVYVVPRPAYYDQGYYGGQGYYNGYNRGYHHGHRRGPYGDADRDGVPNRYDRRPYDPYRY